MRLRNCTALLAALTAWGQAGREWNAEGARYRDPVSGLTVWELTAPPDVPSNLYYHFSNFTADDRHLVSLPAAPASLRSSWPKSRLASSCN